MASEPNNPCTSADGKPKRRWATSDAAWYVVELLALGVHPRHPGQRRKFIVYRCPSCEGWHLTRCKNGKDRQAHRRGIKQLHFWLRKNTQNAGEIRREAE